MSLPNRAVKETTTVETIDLEHGAGTTTVPTVKYYNNIRFESQEKYGEFRKELNDNVLPRIKERLAVL